MHARHLWPYFKQYRYFILVIFSLLIISKLFNIYVPISLQKMIDTLNQTKTITTQLTYIPLYWVIMYAMCRYLGYLTDWLAYLWFTPHAEKIVKEISLKVYTHIQNLSVSFHLKKQSGKLHREFDRGSKGIRLFINYAFFRILPTLLEITLVISWLAYQNKWYYSAIVSVALFLYAIYTFKMTEWRGNLRKRMNQLENQVSQNTHDGLLNFETIKYFDNEGAQIARYEKDLDELAKATIKDDKGIAYLDAGQQLIIAISLVAILGLATQEVLAGTLTIGQFVLLNALILQMYQPLIFLGVMYREIRQAVIDIQNLFALLDEVCDVKDKNHAIDLSLNEPPSIHFKQVCFGYDKHREILHKIDFTIEAGTTTAIVGHSGCGKSTLTRLLFRFYDLDEEQGGDILIDGQSIKNYTQASLRQHLSIVSQDTVLFNDTLEYNIRYGKPNSDIDTWQQASHLAQLDNWVKHLGHGYQTMVGERGLKLSGGEKQRVAIARALLKNTPILVLDEATSALDSKTEASIQQAFNTLSQNRTTLIIAHRLSTIAHAKQIIVMGAGKILEQGNHETLLAKQGIYYNMWQAQKAH